MGRLAGKVALITGAGTGMGQALAVRFGGKARPWPSPATATGSAAVYLCSAEAGYVNGTTLMVDGGWSAYGPTPRFDFVEREGRVGA